MTILIFSIFLLYTLSLFGISYLTSKKSSNINYFIGNRQSPWIVVSYGMIGASLSGVTFISVPGYVGDSGFSYMMVVFGYILGYLVITRILLPIYYKYNLISIYSYLNQRFGTYSYKTGASFFILSRIIGASFQMFLVVNVLQIFIFDHWGIPFWLNALMFALLITLYTFRGGIKTIVWTDTLQTTFMLSALVIILFIITRHLGLDFGQLIGRIRDAGYTKMVVTDWRDNTFFLKQFFSGIFITIVMTGLDQDMMQKNLSCRTLADAQKNMMSLGLLLVPVNLLFMFLGGALYVYATEFGIAIPAQTDDLFPILAVNHFGATAAIVFFIGLIAAAYSSADGAITALTTSFMIDILGKGKSEDKASKRLRMRVHFMMSTVIVLMIVVFKEINNQAVIAQLFTIAGYTYGPLLGLYAFGLFTKRQSKDKWVPWIAILSPLISYLISSRSEIWFNGYKFGFEILIVNGLIMFISLILISTKGRQSKDVSADY